MTNFTSFPQAEKFLIARRARYFPGPLGLKRAQLFLKLLGNPQEKIKVIHIAGTSGKGSTAYLTSKILADLGFKTGLTLSPHLQDIRERLQINNRLISRQKFVHNLNQLFPSVKKMEKSPWGLPTYFEILTALAFYTFNKEKVDYAVIETGFGGRYDATNVIKNPQKIAVFTRIGLDHTHILGKTLTGIARQKAAIIQANNTVVALKQSNSINLTLEKAAHAKNAPLHFIQAGKHFKNIKATQEKTVFDFSFRSLKLTRIELGLLGAHQAENTSLALAALSLLSDRDGFPINRPLLRKTLKGAKFPGRLEIIKSPQRPIIIDGAHNPQKITALIKSLRQLFPRQKFIFLIALKKTKDIALCLSPLLPWAEKIFITDFPGPAHKPILIQKTLRRMNFPSTQIVHRLQEVINQNNRKPLVITGSLYLLSYYWPKIKELRPS